MCKSILQTRSDEHKCNMGDLWRRYFQIYFGDKYNDTLIQVSMKVVTNGPVDDFVQLTGK